MLGVLVVAPALVSNASPRPALRIAAVPRTAAPTAVPVSDAAPKPAGLTPKGKVTPLDFDRDVRPILSENCFACHGFDANKRQAGLRLDTPEGASQKLESGSLPIVPGKPDASPVYQRVAAHTMPPPSFRKRPNAAQTAVLRRWIAEGGKYSAHWAFVAPRRPVLPAVRQQSWAANPIDRFILARLEQEGLKPAPTADRYTLIRRVTFDLTGLPPTQSETDAFVADRQPGAYERLVDRLLASPHYGERMALHWLDLARYADTHGYHIDSHRDMWRWREWVIDAYNKNLPYDQFTIQQLAGDLLPNATLDQKIASGFNRNNPINFEGGAIPEEYRTNYILDRIDTTATTWMALTVRCTQCHDHKYDPLTQREFYQLFAFFNNLGENGLDGQKGNAIPFIKAPNAEQEAQLAGLTKRVAELDQSVKARAAELAPRMAAWEPGALASLDRASTVSGGLAARYTLDEGEGTQVRDASGNQPAGTLHGNPTWTDGRFGKALQLDGATYADLGTAAGFERNQKFSYGAWIYPTSTQSMTIVSRMDDAGGFRGWDLYLGEGKAYVHMIHDWDKNALRVNTKSALELNKWHHLFATYDGSSKAAGIRIYVDGKPAALDVTHDTLTDTIRTDKPLHLGRRNPGALFKGALDDVRIYGRELSADEVAQLAGQDALRQILVLAPEKRTAEQQATLTRYYLESSDETYRKLNTELADTRKKLADTDAAIPTAMVMQEMEKPRDTFMLIRGQYDKKGEKVTTGTPAVLPPMKKDLPQNRLGLAKWLVDPAHPLTARVAVNRYWELYFGAGLVRTSENFGTQGERPTHPELLDWLATEFIRTGWDVKAMQRLIVTSNTYKQDSRTAPAVRQRDPENRLLARGPRFRLPAEFIRDQALAVSGLLVPKIGGPSVRPYQPAGLWDEISFGGGFSAQTYVQDHGEALYRRSMYTFWKRTCPPPSLQTFDAPEREFCMVRRSVTNTPLQALVLMNDPTYIEACRKFAERVLTEPPANTRSRLEFAVRQMLGRPAKETELRVLHDVYFERLGVYTKDPEAARKLLSVGESPRNEKLDISEQAAWTAVANVLLNLDETITKN